MARWLKRPGLALGIAIFSFLMANASAQVIQDIRQGNHGDNDRVVIELDRKTDYRVHRSGQDTILVDIYDVQKSFDLNLPNSLDRNVQDWKSEYYPDHDIYRLYLRTQKNYQNWEDLVLTQPNRIVVDVLTSTSPETSTTSQDFSSRLFPSDHPARNTYGDAPEDSTSTVSVVPLSQASDEVFRPRIIIVDPGHGGHHRGGIGSINGRRVTEADVTPPLGKYLSEMLEADPRFTPKVTRTKDVYVGLRERTALAEEWNGGLFVSIHYNSLPKGRNVRSARGLEFWTWSPKESTSTVDRYLTRLNNEEGDTDVGKPVGSARSVLNQMVGDALISQATESRKLAEAMEGTFLTDSYFRRDYRGIKSGRFKVLENYNMPSVLVEVGFISHPDEAKLAMQKGFQQKVSRYMYNGIVDYYMKHDPGFRRYSESGAMVANR